MWVHEENLCLLLLLAHIGLLVSTLGRFFLIKMPHWYIFQPFVGALAFDIEYARWLEEHNRQINELRGAVNSHAGDNELRIIVDNVISHYEDIFRLKGIAAKADVFHVLSGMWKTPAERCFLWLGGFRSSELLKVGWSLLLKCWYIQVLVILKCLTVKILLSTFYMILKIYNNFIIFNMKISTWDRFCAQIHVMSYARGCLHI